MLYSLSSISSRDGLTVLRSLAMGEGERFRIAACNRPHRDFYPSLPSRLMRKSLLPFFS